MPAITLDKVRDQVEYIRANGGQDPDGVHDYLHEDEDRLYVEILKSLVAGDCPDVVECARLALTLRDLPFIRYYV